MEELIACRFINAKLMTAKQIGHLLTRYFFFAWVEQILVYRKWANKNQWHSACVKGFAVLLAVIVGECCWWLAAVGQITISNWPLPFFMIMFTLNLFFIGIFKFDGIFAVPDRIGLLHSNEPLSFTEVADPRENSFVLGDRGKEHGGYYWMDWLSPTQEQHFRIVGGVSYGRDQLKRLLLRNSFVSQTIAFMCDWAAYSGESFADFIGTKGIIVVEAQHQIAKAVDFVYEIYSERYSLRSKRDEYDNSIRILLFIDEDLMELLEHPEADAPTSMQKTGAQLRELATCAKTHNIHIIAYAKPNRLPNSLESELQAYFKDIVYSYQARVQTPEGGFATIESKHPPFYSVAAVRHQHETYVMKIPTVAEAPKAWIEAQFESFGEAVHDMYADAMRHCSKGKYEPREKREIIVGGETVKANEWQKAEAA